MINMLLYQTVAFTTYTWENIKKSCGNNIIRIWAPTWNQEFELPDESYSVSDIQNYFEFIL